MNTAKTRGVSPAINSSDLMARASQSTRDLGWLQDYTLDWQTVRSLAIRIAVKQEQQPTKDEIAYQGLLEFIALATNKCDTLEEALLKRREAHERLMIKVMNHRNDEI